MQQQVTFTNSKGNKLVGVLSGPITQKIAPVIVMCHGSQSSKNSHSVTDLAEILNKKGVSAFRFDFYGHGGSEGKFENITTAELVDDVLSAIKYLKQNGYKQIGLMGSSMGGGASILAAGRTKDIYLLALKSPVIDFRELYLHRKKNPDNYEGELKYGWNRDSINFSGHESLKRLKIPTAIVHGTKDTEVPIQFSKSAVKLNPLIKLYLVPGADHRYSNLTHFRKLLTHLSNFIIKESK